jgi:hypothetical protein
MGTEAKTLWDSIEEMPEFQAKSPQEKLDDATYFLQKVSASMAPDLAGNPEAQGYFREKSKKFLFKIAEDHFPSALEALPGQLAEGVAREDRSLSLKGARLNTEIGEEARQTLAGLEGKPDAEILPGDPNAFQSVAPNVDTPVGEYRKYLEGVVAAQEVKAGRKAGAIAESFEESDRRTPSAAMMQLGLAEGWGGWDDFISKNPDDKIGSTLAAISGVMAESAVQSAKGAVPGAIAAAGTGGNPVAGGLVMGAVAADSEFQATYLNELKTEIEAKGGKVDAESIQAILKDEEFNRRVDKKAAIRGATIGATEGVAGLLSFGIANKIGGGTVKKALTATGAGAGIDAVGGSGGEFLARLFSGDDIWTPEARKDIISEGVAEMGQAATGAASVALREIRQRGESQTPETPASGETEGTQGPSGPEPPETAPAPPAPPDLDDGPVRSVIEEFEPETGPAEPAPSAPLSEEIPASPALEPIPETVPALEETAGGEEVATPETPGPVEEEAPSSDPVVAHQFDIDEGLQVRVIQGADGTARVEKVNTETGATIPLEGAETAFENPRAALAYLSETFATDEGGNVVSEEEASPEVRAHRETDDLMILLQAEKMRPVQSDIGEIGRVSRARTKGFRGHEKDTGNRGYYDGAPLLGEFEGGARARLRGIYDRNSKNRPDQVAQMAFEAGLIADPSPNALFAAIRERLATEGGEVAATSNEQAEAAAAEFERAQAAPYEAFFRSIKSPYRRGGLVPARQLQVGDVLEVGGDRVTVTETDGDTVMVRSERYGEHGLGLDERVGYDAIEENGLPIGERETIPEEDRVSREEAEALTAFLRERLNLKGGNSQARVVPSREHSTVAKSAAELDAARRIARFFDSTVVGVSGLPAQGAISRKQVQDAQEKGGRKFVFLATDADRVEFLLTMHEMLHSLRVTDSDLYNELLAAMGVVFDKDGNLPRDENGRRILGADLEKYISDVREEHESLSDEMLVEEFLADLFAERAGTNEFWEGLAMRDPATFGRFVNFVLDFIRKVADRIRNDRVKVERYLRDAAAMRRAMEEVLVAFRARQTQENRGILDVPLDESMPFSDLRFADRRTKPNQRVFGQDIGREDEIQGEAEVTDTVRSRYFDGTQPVSHWSKEDAFTTLATIEAGEIDAAAETGLDGANGALKGELWTFAMSMIREEGDDSLFARMRGRSNDYFEREATKSARALNALGWYTRHIDQNLAEVERGKRAAVNANATPDAGGQLPDVSASIDELQRDIDRILVTIADFTPSEIAAVTATVAGKRTDLVSPTIERTAKMLGGGRKGGRRLASLAAEFEDFLSGGSSDLLFSDPAMSAQDREFLIRRVLEEQVRSGKRKRAVFIRTLQGLGLSEEVAANRFTKAMEFRERAKVALKEDLAEMKGRTEERSARDKFLEALDAEAKRLDRLNQKAEKIAARIKTGPKPRPKADPSKKSDLEQLVSGGIASGADFNREDTIKEAIRQGLTQEAASDLADSIGTEIKNRAGKQKGPKSIDDRAKEIAGRYRNPKDTATAKDPLRKLINETIRVSSAVTEEGFLDRMRGLGASKAESLDLWNALADERAKRQEIRDLKRQADEEKAATNEAIRIIKKLAASQSDTQDNRPGPKPEISLVEQRYRELFLPDRPLATREEFIHSLEPANVDAATAGRLYELGIREKQDREKVGSGKAAVRAVDRSVPFLMREILANPSIKLVGPEERLRLVAKLFEERAGLAPVDARTAAVKFDAILVQKWEEAAVRLAETHATKRNAPWFRRKPGAPDPTRKTTFDRIREAIRAGALDPRRRVLDEVAKGNGWTDLSSTDLQRLSELDAALDAENLTWFEDVRIKREMSRLINASSIPAETKRVVREYYLASIFSGVKTWVLQGSVSLNILANMGFRDPVTAILGSATGSKRQNLGGYMAALSSMTRYLKNAVTDGSLALLTGDIRGIQEAEILAAVSSLEKVHDKNLAIWNDPRATLAQKTAAVTKMFLASNRFFFRILSGLDNTFQGFIRSYTSELELFSQASGLGMSGKAMRELTGEVVSLAPKFAEEADAKGFKGADKAAFVNDRITMALYAALEGRGVASSEIQAVRDRSFREAGLETGVVEFQTGMTPAGKLAQHLQKWSNEGGILSTLIVPVVRTPFQVLHRSAWWSPYGLARLLHVARKTKGFRAWRNADGTLTSPYETALADPVQLMRRAAETALGTSAFVLLAALLAGEEDKEEEDRTVRVNLGGPSTANRTQYTAWRVAGHRPHSIQFKVGDRWVTMGFRKGGMEFFNFAGTLLGAWDQRQFEKLNNSNSDWMNYTSTAVKELSGESLFFLRGFSSRYALMSEESFANQMGFMLSGFIPAASLLKTPNKLFDYEEPDGPRAAFASQFPVVPFLGDRRPMLNSLGDPLGANERERTYVQSKFGFPMGWVPFKKRAGNGETAQDEDVYLLLHEKGYFPSVKSRKEFGADVPLEVYHEFVRRRGGLIKQFIRENYADLSQLEGDKFSDAIGSFATKVTKSLQREMAGE